MTQGRPLGCDKLQDQNRTVSTIHLARAPYRLHHQLSRCASYKFAHVFINSGRKTLNSVPAPGLLVTSMLPSCAAIIPDVIDNPRPVPLSFVEKNGSNIFDFVSWSIPGPLSRIDISIAEGITSEYLISTIMFPPSGIAWTEFKRMLINACLNNPLSAYTE